MSKYINIEDINIEDFKDEDYVLIWFDYYNVSTESYKPMVRPYVMKFESWCEGFSDDGDFFGDNNKVCKSFSGDWFPYSESEEDFDPDYKIRFISKLDYPKEQENE